MKSTPTVSPLYSTHNNASDGGGRKVHLSIDEGPALCGRTDDFFNLGLPYVDIEKQFFLDPDGNGCRACGRIYRQRTAPKQNRMAIGAVLLLLLSVPSLAQQPQPVQIVSNCVKGVYDECQFVPPHWYYLKNGIWTRDDGLVGKPPAVTVVPCPADSVTKLQPVQPKIIAGVSGLRLNKSNDSSWNVHFWTSSAVFFGGSFADWASSRGRRELGPLRNSTGGLNSGAYWSLNGGLYTLSVIIQKRHPKGASVIRYVVGAVHFGDAAWNWSTR